MSTATLNRYDAVCERREGAGDVKIHEMMWGTKGRRTSLWVNEKGDVVHITKLVEHGDEEGSVSQWEIGLLADQVEALTDYFAAA